MPSRTRHPELLGEGDPIRLLGIVMTEANFALERAEFLPTKFRRELKKYQALGHTVSDSEARPRGLDPL